MAESAPTLDDIFAELERRRAEETNDGRPGAEWFNYEEYMARYGMSIRCATYWLDKDLRAGRVEKVKRGRLVWFRLVEK
jgi:hypothetical protein